MMSLISIVIKQGSSTRVFRLHYLRLLKMLEYGIKDIKRLNGCGLPIEPYDAGIIVIGINDKKIYSFQSAFSRKDIAMPEDFEFRDYFLEKNAVKGMFTFIKDISRLDIHPVNMRKWVYFIDKHSE